MAQIHATETQLAVHLTGARRAIGRRRPMAIPWNRIADAHIDPEATWAFPGARWGVAINIPGATDLGSCRHGGRHDFWDVADPESAIVIDLIGAKYDEFVIEVDGPASPGVPSC